MTEKIHKNREEFQNIFWLARTYTLDELLTLIEGVGAQLGSEPQGVASVLLKVLMRNEAQRLLEVNMRKFPTLLMKVLVRNEALGCQRQTLRIS